MFVTSHDDGRIMIWNRSNTCECYYINEQNNISVKKVIFDSKRNLIYCSSNGNSNIKFSSNYTNDYITINTFNNLSSILLLEDKNILISAGYELIIWNYINFHRINSFDNISTELNTSLYRLDDDKIIVCNNTNLLIFSISGLIIKEINIYYTCYSIKVFQNKRIFLVGGNKN